MAYANKKNLNAHQRERQRKRTADEDFMRNLLGMGKPSSIVYHAQQGSCDLCRAKSIASLVYPTETIEICERHERMRKNGKTR